MFKKLLYGFKRKIFIGISVIAILMMTLLSTVTYFSVLSSLTSNQQLSLNKINQILVNNIESCIMDMKNAIFYIIASDDLSVITLPEYFGTNDFFASQKQFEVLLTSFGKSRDFDSIYLFVPENGFVISQNMYDAIWDSTPDNIKELETYKQILNKNERLGVLSDITKVSYYNSNIFGVYYKINDEIFIEVTMDKKFFSNILNNVYGKHFEYIIITDENDNLVYSNDMQFTNELSNIKSYNKGIMPTKISVGKESYITSRQVSEAVGWKVTTFTNYKVIKSSTWEISRIMVLITAVFVLIMIAFAYLLSLRLSLHARKLATTMKMAPENNYTSFERIKSNDEFGEISDSFIEMMNELMKNKINAKDMQIRVLQQQINPHFLYNTFDVLSYFIMNNQNDAAIELIEKLSDMFRYNVYNNNQYMTTIKNEVQNLENYLFIIQKRIGDTLEINWEVDENILNFITPKFILQPIVENVFKHGFREYVHQKIITIKGYPKDNDVIFEVIDNGIGLKIERLEEVQKALLLNHSDTGSGFGIGLLNINSRLKLEYGEEYGIEIESELNKDTIVKIRIPQSEDRSGQF